MNLAHGTDRFRIGSSLPGAVVLISLLGAGVTQGQEAPRPPTPPSPPRAVPMPLPPAPPGTPGIVEAEQIVKVYQLKNLSADVVANTIANVYGGHRICVSVRETNSVIVSCSQPLMAKIESLIDTLEKSAKAKPTPPSGPETAIHSLKNIPVDNTLESILRTALGLSTGEPQPCASNPLALDRDRRLVVLRGDRELLDTAAKVLEQLDQPVPAEPKVEVAGVRVRIVWLLSGLKRAEIAAPPADLKEIVEDLKGLGIADLKLAAQTIVQTVPGADFKTSCTLTLDDPSNLNIVGSLGRSDSGAAGKLRIGLSATRTVTVNNTMRNERIVDLDSSIICATSRPTVLSVTPTDTATSVVIVQVLPVK